MHAAGTELATAGVLIAFITGAPRPTRFWRTSGSTPSPHITPALGPPLWDDSDAQMDHGVQIEPDWDLAMLKHADFLAQRGR